jgi:hypothetical protein
MRLVPPLGIEGDHQTVRLQQKLLRELAQSEYDAYLHTRREADRLGSCPPALVFLDISQHADGMRARLEALMEGNQSVGHALGTLVGRTFSNLRHYGVDRVLASERSYRATLLGLRHGLDATHLLRFVSRRLRTTDVSAFCDELISVREPSLARAVAALEWFANHSDHPHR